MGGDGTWALGAKYPDRWAALVPVASLSTPEWAAKVKDIPTWAFEGSEDKEGNVQKGREAVEFVRKLGGKPKYTEFPGVGRSPNVSERQATRSQGRKTGGRGQVPAA